MLPVDEERFLKLVEPSGLDWRTSYRTYCDRFGGKVLQDGSTEVTLPPTTVLSDDQLIFRMEFDKNEAHAVPKSLKAKFENCQNVQEKFLQLEQQMRRKLGEGEREDISTILSTKWNFGMFEVKLEGCPYEMRAEWYRRENKPDPAHDNIVTVSITSQLWNPYPRNDLEWIAKVISGLDTTRSADVLKLQLAQTAISSIVLNEYAFRNTEVFEPVLGNNEVAVWRSKDGMEIGISISKYSFVFPKKCFKKLVLHRLSASRGPDEALLCLSSEKAPMSHVLTSDNKNGLDSCAGTISDFWSLPLNTVDTTND